jgi:hypothetical protein
MQRLQKKIELSNMGRQAIVSHIKSALHQKNIKLKCTNVPIKNLGNKDTQDKPHNVTTPNLNSMTMVPQLPQQLVNNQESMNLFQIREATIKAEILWALNVVGTHQSWNSVVKDVPVMKMMFPDSPTCQQIAISPAKIAYAVCHGLAPFFNEELLQKMDMCKKFVVCFDESLNKVAQKGQMDLLVRFWDEKLHQVQTRYVTSVFLSHCTAEDLLAKFTAGIRVENLKKIVQVRIDHFLLKIELIVHIYFGFLSYSRFRWMVPTSIGNFFDCSKNRKQLNTSWIWDHVDCT